MIEKFKSLGRLAAAHVFAALYGVVCFFDSVLFGPQIMRARTADVAFTYRMGAGYPGDINRTHPFSVLPGLINLTTPPRRFGDGVLVDASTNSYRGFVVGDASNSTAVALKGVTVRSYPTQQTSGGMSSSLGTAVPPISGVADFLREGYIMAQIPAGVTVAKGGQVFVWCAASSGAHVLGGFEGAASTGNTVPLSNAQFTGPADANGVCEIEVTAA